MDGQSWGQRGLSLPKIIFKHSAKPKPAWDSMGCEFHLPSLQDTAQELRFGILGTKTSPGGMRPP